MSQDYETRDRCRRAMNALVELSCLEAATLYEPADTPQDAYAVELAIAGDHVPPAVLRELALDSLALHSIERRGSPPHLLVVASA